MYKNSQQEDDIICNKTIGSLLVPDFRLARFGSTQKQSVIEKV